MRVEAPTPKTGKPIRPCPLLAGAVKPDVAKADKEFMKPFTGFKKVEKPVEPLKMEPKVEEKAPVEAASPKKAEEKPTEEKTPSAEEPKKEEKKEEEKEKSETKEEAPAPQ